MRCSTPVFLFIIKVEVDSVGGTLNLYRQMTRLDLNLSALMDFQQEFNFLKQKANVRYFCLLLFVTQNPFFVSPDVVVV